MSDEGRCRSCGAVIAWLTTRNDKAIPCDPELVELVPLDREDPDQVSLPRISGIDELGAVVFGTAPTADTPRGLVRHVRVSHFATCPNARQHRKVRT